MKEPTRTDTGAEKAKADRASVLSLADEQGLPVLDSGVCGGDVFAGRDLVVDAVVFAADRRGGYCGCGDRYGHYHCGVRAWRDGGGRMVAQWWSKKTSKALYLVPALSALLAVPPAVLCFFGPKSVTLPALGVAVFLIFLGTGPVNAATLNAVPGNLRATAMAGQLFTIHVLGDMLSPKLIGFISDRSNLRYGLAVDAGRDGDCGGDLLCGRAVCAAAALERRDDAAPVAGG